VVLKKFTAYSGKAFGFSVLIINIIYRVDRGLKVKWGSVNPGLGTTMLSKGMTPGIMGQSFIVRLMLAWHWIGYNRVKGPKAKVKDGACPLCGEFEDIEHILRSCKDPEMCRYRKETWKQLEQFLRFAVERTVCSAAEEIAAYAASDPVIFFPGGGLCLFLWSG